MVGTEQKKLTSRDVVARKGHGKIVMLTAYDFQTARLIEAAGVDVILVGDSLGMAFQGHTSTIPVTLDDVIYHCRTVVRGAPKTHIVADLPFLSYQESDAQALRNGARLLQEGGADSVKLEGGVLVQARIRALVNAGIPVMGHIGLGPQSVGTTGGFRVQGRDLESAKAVVADAKAVEEAGAFAVVIELVPSELAKIVSEQISIPTIGIGAGAGCDGQVLISSDVIGFDNGLSLKFVRRYAEIGKVMGEAFAAYTADVRSGSFPAEAESRYLKAEVADALRREFRPDTDEQP